MVRFRNHRTAPTYLSRRDQLRLLALVFVLGLVLISMRRAARPESWYWLWGGAAPAEGETDVSPPQGDATIDTRLPDRPQREQPLGLFRSPAPQTADASREKQYFPGVVPEHLADVRDDTVFRPAEHRAWFNLCGILARTEPERLVEASTGRKSFVQLFDQPRLYRGELVTVRGDARRAAYRTAPANDEGIEGYYQIWLRPRDNLSNPMAVYCLEIPNEFPTGADLDEPIELTGFFFKRWAYAAGDGLRTAPLLVARTLAWRQTPAPGATSETARLLAYAVGGALVVAALATLLVWRQSQALGRRTPPAMMLWLVIGWLAVSDGSAAPADDRPSGGAVPIAEARDLLLLFGLEESQLDRLEDDRPVDAAAQSELLPILYAARRCPAADVERLARPQEAFTQWLEEPAGARGRIVHLRGRVRRANRLVPERAEADRFELEEYFRCELVIDDPAMVVTVYSSFVPQAWKTDESIDERASIYGFFLNRTRDGDQRGAVLVARRVAWYPETILGDLGMDVGLFDEVRNKTRMELAERECFYQLMAAVEWAGASELVRRKQGQVDSVTPLFMESDTQHGRLVALEGIARRAIEVRVEDPDVAGRFGIDRYYEVEIFTDDSQRNPVVFCMLELPDGMPRGEGIFAHVRMIGFVFKLWAYPRAVGDRDELQVAPLLIGHRPFYRPPAGAAYAGWIAGVLFLVVLVGIWLFVWRMIRSDRQSGRRMFARKYRPPQGEAFEGFDTEAEDGPGRTG